MYLLKKMIDLREKSHPDHEKPFLEHLEDLRKMVMRIVITLIISVVACFSFQKSLMDVLREPVEKVYRLQTAEKLPGKKQGIPRPLDVDTWNKAKNVSAAMGALNGNERQAFLAAIGDETMRFHVEAVSLLRAAQALPEENRETFLRNAAARPELVRQVQGLLVKNPGTDASGRGDLMLMSALKPTESFMLSMKLAFFAGVVVAFPFLLVFILQFVLPGLHKNERKVLWPAMAVGFGLFLAGVAFAYFMILPRALLFFADWSGDMGISNDWRIGEYISFASQFTLLFGVSFELPVIVMVFVKLGVLGYETMQRTRSYAIIGIFLAAAVLTPTPDWFTMSLMAGPMVVLYEICIWMAWLQRKKERKAEQLAREEEEKRMWETYDREHSLPREEATENETDGDPESESAESKDEGWSADYEPPQGEEPDPFSVKDPDEYRRNENP